MKETLKFIFIAVLIFVIVLSISIPIVNNISAAKVEKELLKIELPENTEITESLSEAGKFTGNGNGMQYLGAMLIKSELSLEELDRYYSKKNKYIEVEEQNSQKIEHIEHGEISFKNPVSADENYYIVYLYGEGIEFFAESDIRGH